MNPSSNELERLQRRALQLEAREQALRAAVQEYLSRRIATPARLAGALSAGVALGLIGARGKRAMRHGASSRIGWLRGITLAVELGGALMSLASLLGARAGGTPRTRPSDVMH